MERTHIFKLLVITILLSFIPIKLWAYSGGTGEPNDPYQIATAEDLIALGNEPNDYDKHFILTADIDLSGYTFDRAVIAPDINDVNFSFQGVNFSGCFNGQGHVICHLYIIGEDYLGLFGDCTSRAIVMNLGLEDVEINGNSNSSCTGGVIGWNSGTVTACYSTGVLSGSSYVGGLVGYNKGTIKSSYSTGTVMGTYYAVGGLVGYQSFGIITNSYSAGSVTGEKQLGGLVGDNYNNGKVLSSFWDVESSGQSISAGGGTGLTSAELQAVTTYTNAGWDLAEETADGTRDFWIVHEGNYPRLAMFSGYSPAELHGSGTQEDPYLLTDAHELGSVWHRPWAHYRLDSDIDMTGMRWNSAVVPDFAGSFDGNGYVIRHLCIEGYWNLGLFGYCWPQATIINLGLEDVEIVGEPNSINVGGLVGQNYGIVTSCYSAGTVSGSQYISILAGFNAGSILSSYSAGGVSGAKYVGGLAGYNSVLITSSYSTGTVRGTEDVGGLVGGNGDGSITSCYSIGVVSGTEDVGGLVGWNLGTVNFCCWDIETSTQAKSDGGIGLTTAEMKALQTYIDADWDLVNESAHGTCNYWVIENQEYPQLAVFSGWVPPEPYGRGTADDPYLVTDINELGTIWYRPQAHYCLETDLDLSEMIWHSAIIPGFRGCFEGQGHTLEDLHITGGGSLGLFGYCLSTAAVTNLNLEAVEVNGVGQMIGGLAGRNKGLLTTCSCAGSVNGDDYIGGLVGSNSGTIISGYCNTNVRGMEGKSQFVGGLVGLNSGAILSSSMNGEVNGWNRVGGLVGWNDNTITSSDCNAVVNGFNLIGGLVGDNDGMITSCYSTGGVSGEYRVGGLVGSNWGPITLSHSSSTIIAIKTSFDRSGEVEVSGGVFAGGLIGYNYGYHPITSCYSTGAVSGGDYVGGLVGRNYYDEDYDLEMDMCWLLSSYSTGDVSGEAYVGGLVGDNLGPIMSSYSTGSVSGTEHVGGLIGENGRGPSAHSKVGLVALNYSTGTVNGRCCTGGLVGLNYGMILSCYSTGDVSGEIYTGGLIGNNGYAINWAENEYLVSLSYSTGTVNGESFTGGLMGQNSDVISSCYSTGIVHGTDYVGGLVGSNSYGLIMSCFWDIDSSGQDESDDGIGLSTAEMQDINTFLDEGWDFVDETTNGTDDTWWMPQNDYPRLWWESF